MKTTTCKLCGTVAEYIPVEINGRDFGMPYCCDECGRKASEEQAQRDAAARQRKRAAAWQALCPPEYDATVREHLPHPGMMDVVLRWSYGPRGIILHGETGSGKTRCAFSLLKRIHFEGRDVAVIRSADLADYMVRRFESQSAVRWWKGRTGAEVLLLDDVFKANMSEAVEAELFGVIEERTSYRRPMIVTTNDVGQSLAGRLRDDRAGPLVRRLREFCQSVAFPPVAR